jgi:hypothetical protein
MTFQLSGTNRINLSQFPESLEKRKKRPAQQRIRKPPAMSRFFNPIHDRATRLADAAQPVIIAMGTAGLTGGAMAAIALFTDRAMQSRAAAQSAR